MINLGLFVKYCINEWDGSDKSFEACGTRTNAWKTQTVLGLSTLFSAPSTINLVTFTKMPLEVANLM
jgi:hypothetical protein